MDEELVRKLSRHTGELMRVTHAEACSNQLPSPRVLSDVLDQLRSVLFPGYFGATDWEPESLGDHLGGTLDRVNRTLADQIRRGLCFTCANPDRREICATEADQLCRDFLARLPDIQQLLVKDVQTAYESDPATTSPAEAIFCSPGVSAITDYRIAHALLDLGIPLLPRMITEHAHRLTGIDIHPGAKIGESLFIDHGTGVVVGETSVIGDRVRIYQGVTLGAKSFPLDADGKPIKGKPRHPIVEDDVVIYSGATILGRVTVGRGAVIGGNVWLTRSVAPGTVVTQQTPDQEAFCEGGGI